MFLFYSVKEFLRTFSLSEREEKCSWYVNYSNSVINIKAIKANPTTYDRKYLF